MEQLLQFFILLPLVGFLVSLFFRNRNENALAGIAITTVGIQLVALIAFVFSWITEGSHLLNIKHFTTLAS